jgi:hypothetical protein
MLPPTTLHRGRFPRTLIDYHSGVVSVGLHVSSKILDLLSQLIAVIRERVPALRSSTYLDIIEGIVGARGIQYLSEAAVTGVVAFQLAALCVRHRGVPYKDFEALRNSRLYVESIESNMPHVVRWYRVIYGLNIGGRLMECAEVFRNSPSILGRTPAAATRQHSEEIARGLWRQPPAAGQAIFVISPALYKTKRTNNAFQKGSTSLLPNSPHRTIRPDSGKPISAPGCSH